jgi:hypothetical protein
MMDSQTFISDFYPADDNKLGTINTLMQNINIVIDDIILADQDSCTFDFDKSDIRKTWETTMFRRDVDLMVKLCLYIIKNVNTDYRCYNVPQDDRRIVMIINKKTYEVAILSKDRPLYDTLIETKFREIGHLLSIFCDKYES